MGIAALRVYEKSRDRDLLTRLYPHLSRHQEWLDRRRDPDGDHLVSLIHPWESGWDASPRWDAPMKLENPTVQETHDARDELMKPLRDYHFDAQKLAEAGYFHVEAVDFNAIRALDLLMMAQIARLLGHHEDAQKWESKYQQVKAAIQQKMITPEGIIDLDGLAEIPIKKPSAAPFILMVSECVDQATAAKLVQEMTSQRFWPAYGISTTPTDDPYFVGDHYWRGNVWMSVNWLIYTGLRRMGFTAEASQLARRSLELVDQHGFHEFFNPITGQGHGPALQSWTAVMLDMLATELEAQQITD